MASAVINGIVVTGSPDEIYQLIQKATIRVTGGTATRLFWQQPRNKEKRDA